METLPKEDIRKIRMSRRHPSRAQFDYLHLRRLVEDLSEALGQIDERVTENGGRGVAWATMTGRLLQLREKSLPEWLRPVAQPLFAAAYLAVNGMGAVLERGERRNREADPMRLPMNLMLTARRPS